MLSPIQTASHSRLAGTRRPYNQARPGTRDRFVARAPSPTLQPKSDLSDFGRLTSGRTRVNPSSAASGNPPRARDRPDGRAVVSVLGQAPVRNRRSSVAAAGVVRVVGLDERAAPDEEAGRVVEDVVAGSADGRTAGSGKEPICIVGDRRAVDVDGCVRCPDVDGAAAIARYDRFGDV